MHITHFTTECKFAEQIIIIYVVSPGLLVHHHLHYILVQTGNQALLVPLGSVNLEFKSNKIKFVLLGLVSKSTLFHLSVLNCVVGSGLHRSGHKSSFRQKLFCCDGKILTNIKQREEQR